jgi:hypothetical protein
VLHGVFDDLDSYVLLLTIITTPIDGVTTQRVPGFNSIQECAEHAAGWGMSQPLERDSCCISVDCSYFCSSCCLDVALKACVRCSLSRGRLSHVGGLGYDFGDHAVECVRDNMAVIQILG